MANGLALPAALAMTFVTEFQAATSGPLDHAALLFDGETSLRTDALPKSASDKGWAFSAWVKRERAADSPLFSTMKFNVPESSQSYGNGAEIRLTAQGAVRCAARNAGRLIR